MAKALISSMTTEWKPEDYKDEYRHALEKLIEEKVEHPHKAPAHTKLRHRPSNVIDLVKVLQESLGSHGKSAKHGSKPKSSAKKKKAKATKAKSKAA